MKVVWTKTAELTFQAEIDFILKKWTPKEVKKFVDLVDEIIDKLKEFPLLGRYSESGDLYLTISKQITLVYRLLDHDVLELLLFWNNKQNPKDLEKIIGM